MFSCGWSSLVVLSVVLASVEMTSPPRYGGKYPVDKNSNTIRMMAAAAVQALGIEHILTNITRAYESVVGGMKYEIDIEVTKTLANGEAKQLSCNVKMLDRAWIPALDLINYCCDLHTSESTS